MQKWNLIVDVANCTNCNVCALAVQDEHVGNAFPGYAEEMPKHGHRWIEIKRRERGTPPVTDVAYLPTMCQHCDDAPCIAAAPDAITKRPDGIVVIDPVKSKGRRDLVEACPYGAIWWNLDKSYLLEIFSRHSGSAPEIFVKPLTRTPNDFQLVGDNSLSAAATNLEHTFPLHFRLHREQLCGAGQIEGKEVATVIIETNGAQCLTDPVTDLGFTHPISELRIKM